VHSYAVTEGRIAEKWGFQETKASQMKNKKKKKTTANKEERLNRQLC
jgi:hypothetical protein